MSRLDDDLRTLSREAYIYLYPLVTMEISRRQAMSLPAGVKPGFGPVNQFHHLRTFPPADFRAVVRPNFDTLYANAWFDLTGGPVRLHVPDTHDRYYMLPLLDMWTDVFATIGKRTTGTAAQDFVLVGPGYEGELPAGHIAIHAPTPHGWIIGRIQTNGVQDYHGVHAVQDGLALTPLHPNAASSESYPEQDTDTEALALVNAMDAVEFFSLASEALLRTPPHATDFSVLARIATVGIVPGRLFDATGFTDDEWIDIRTGAVEALQQMIEGIPTMGTAANGWTSFSDVIGVYGNDYLARARVALAGLGANPREDALYPLLVADENGEPIVGDNDYVLHFDHDQLPPAAAFWSVTMYDDEGFQVANELNRFAIGDRDDLHYNEDGSLDLYLQHRRPAEHLVANWLPAPNGPLGVNLRLYAPRQAALDGTWQPPIVKITKE